MPDTLHTRAVAGLVNDVTNRTNFHLDTGAVTTSFLLNVNCPPVYLVVSLPFSLISLSLSLSLSLFLSFFLYFFLVLPFCSFSLSLSLSLSLILYRAESSPGAEWQRRSRHCRSSSNADDPARMGFLGVAQRNNVLGELGRRGVTQPHLLVRRRRRVAVETRRGGVTHQSRVGNCSRSASG